MKTCCFLGAVFVVVLIFVFLHFVYQELVFYQLPFHKVKCTLLSYSSSPSTLKTRVAPVIGSNGDVSCAVYTTGNAAQYTTLWDCGKFGRLMSTNEKLFRFAQDRMVLLIKSNDYDTRIVGFVKEDEE